ncbi:NAD(P)H-dependent oxidoreductase [Christiangramia salexigens]|uniref:NAD(P)H-dependent oxidoreductase n=1 Tax=Christiangramia salexigens TaxID=1913577 RepID=A0A1L3J853_9FLAO|nr:NAD(P)H-dependent oxidoreductase [Christiangramia salexigens]APG61309.1 NAD(P)H-dependent oxidoreductase [Christiangramia salexigens]
MNLEVREENYIENLNWRYATKKFDATKNLKETELEKLIESVRLSASSYGLQPYEVIVIENPEIKEKLKAAAWNQPQLTDASHIFVFANFKKIDASHIDDYLNNIAETRNLSREDLKGMEDMLKNTVLNFTEEEQQIWASKQTYIALGNLLAAAAEFKIDTCPMEGFNSAQFDEILNLEEKNLSASVVATVGYRSDKDPMQHLEKVRKSKQELFHIL